MANSGDHFIATGVSGHGEDDGARPRYGPMGVGVGGWTLEVAVEAPGFDWLAAAAGRGRRRRSCEWLAAAAGAV